LLPCLLNFFCLGHLLNSSNNTEKLFATSSIIPCTLKIVQEKKNCHLSQSPEGDVLSGFVSVKTTSFLKVFFFSPYNNLIPIIVGCQP